MKKIKENKTYPVVGRFCVVVWAMLFVALVFCPNFVKADIIDQPRDQRVLEGETAEFSLTAEGDNLQYQWQRDNENIPDATDSFYSLKNVTLNDDGSWFRNQVVTSSENEMSQEAQLVVFQKGDLDRNSEINKDDVNILRRYFKKDVVECPECDLNSDGRIDKHDVNLVRQSCDNEKCERSEPLPPFIKEHPRSRNVIEGHWARFRVTVSFNNKYKDDEDDDDDDDDDDEVDEEDKLNHLTYQWQKNGVDIPGATRSVLWLPDVNLEDHGSLIRCRITYDYGSIVSRPALISVQPLSDLYLDEYYEKYIIKSLKKDLNWLEKFGFDEEFDDHWRMFAGAAGKNDDDEDKWQDYRNPSDGPLILSQPVSSGVSEGGIIKFTVKAVGRRLRYQWQKNGENIPGATGQEYELKDTEFSENACLYRCVITDKDENEVISSEAELTVYHQGDYDWDGDIDYHDVNILRQYLGKRGTSRGEYDFDGDRFVSLNDLRILMDECHCPKCQEPVVPTIVEHPADLVVMEGQPATFKVSATSIGRKFTYQWQENGVNIPGATKTRYTFIPDLHDHGKTYRCIVTNVAGSVVSNSATLGVEMDVPPNPVGMVNAAAEWQQQYALLTWEKQDGFRYQIHRGSKAEEISLLTEVDGPPYLDKTAAYYFGWYYQFATVKDYFHPVSGKVYHSVGPLTEPIYLAAQPSPKVTVLQGFLEADGSYSMYFEPGGITVNGSYETMEGLVNISATLGSNVVTTSSDTGSFSLLLTYAGLWTIDLAEVNGWRSASVKVDLKADSKPPMLIVEGASQQTTSESSITLTGRATDDESGLKSVTIASDRYNGQVFGAVIDSTGVYTGTIPLQVGVNKLTVIAQDRYGNEEQQSVDVTYVLPSLPKITILTPENGSTVETEEVDLTGSVRSSLPAGKIRLLFNNQVYFPTGTDGQYSFSIVGVKLKQGANTLEVRAETPYGSVSAQTTIYYDTPPEEEPKEPPVIEVLSPLPNVFLTEHSFQVSGYARSLQGIASVLVNGVNATITGAGEEVSFQANLDFGGASSLTIFIEAKDSDNLTSSLSYQVSHDDGPPVLTLSNVGLQLAPTVNSVVETPYPLSGTVKDANLAGLSINDQPVNVLPVDQEQYQFDAQIELVRGEERPLIISAWDMAGNRTDAEVILRHDAGLDIEIISPRTESELLTVGNAAKIEVTVRAPGLAEDDVIEVAIDGSPINGLVREATTIHGTVSLTADNSDHELTAQVISATGLVLARATSAFTVVDVNTLPLDLEKQEPENGAQGVETNGFLAFYFNRPIDPALLQVEVRETVHGLNYLSPDAGADITKQSKIELVEVHRDRELVPGALAHFPEKTMTAFYPDRTLAFGAIVYISVIYDGEELTNSSFKTKPLPTFIQGFIADQFSQPIEGINVSIPKLKRTAVTDKEGCFTFGMGEKAEQLISGGRYLAVVNPGLSNRSFGTAEFWVTAEEGRFNSVGVIPLPILNPGEPFRRIASGDSQVLLASGELILDLTDAALEFANGKNDGDVHVQFMDVTQLPYTYRPSAMPQWAFVMNPGSINVTGKVGLTFNMPTMFDSHDYVERIGDRVVLIGLDPNSLQLVPVGVGKVDVAAKQVLSEGKVSLKRLDCLAYGLIDAEKQPVLESYVKDEITLSELTSRLEQQ